MLLDPRFKKQTLSFDNCQFTMKDGKAFLKEQYDKFVDQSSIEKPVFNDPYVNEFNIQSDESEEWKAYFDTNDYNPKYYL